MVQSRVAEATGQLHRARLSARNTSCDLGGGDREAPGDAEQRAQLRIADHRRHRSGAAGGGLRLSRRRRDATFNGSAFERRFRDAHVTAQDQAHLSNFEGAGQALFGIETAQRL